MKFFLYLITYLCIIATFFNDGFSKMFFSIPFIFFLLADSILSKSYRTFIFNAVAITVLLILAFTRFTNPFIYPVLQQKLIAPKDYHLTHSPYSTSTLIEVKNLDDYFEDKEQLTYYKSMDLYKEYTLKKGTLITPVKIVISGHPDITGISYKLQVDINDSQLKSSVKKYIASHNQDIGLEINRQLPEKMQDKYIQNYRYSVANSGDSIYAGSWYFENFPKQKKYGQHYIESIIEKTIGWIVFIFNPMFIWVYLILFAWQFYYIKKKYNLTYKKV